MTPTTTPGPRTHEEAPKVQRWECYIAPSRSGYIAQIDDREDDDGRYVLYADWEAERTRADALAARLADAEQRADWYDKDRQHAREARDVWSAACERAEARIAELEAVVGRYKPALEMIARVNAMDYEYQRWARDALGDTARGLLGKEG